MLEATRCCNRTTTERLCFLFHVTVWPVSLPPLPARSAST